MLVGICKISKCWYDGIYALYNIVGSNKWKYSVDIRKMDNNIGIYKINNSVVFI